MKNRSAVTVMVCWTLAVLAVAPYAAADEAVLYAKVDGDPCRPG